MKHVLATDGAVPRGSVVATVGAFVRKVVVPRGQEARRVSEGPLDRSFMSRG
jgi:hypothetical protein